MYQKCVFCPLLPRTVQTVSPWAGLFAGGWHLSVSFLGAPHFSQPSERGGRESHVCLICIPSPARQTLCWVLCKYNDVGWEIFFMNIFSHSIWEKYSFKAGVCPPAPRWLMCAQACTNRHHCSALQDHDFFWNTNNYFHALQQWCLIHCRHRSSWLPLESCLTLPSLFSHYYPSEKQFSIRQKDEWF